MNIVRFALVGVSLALLPGCSLMMVQGPQPVGHPDRETSSQTCTTSKQWVAVDGVLGGGLVFVAAAALADAKSFNGWSPVKAGAVAPLGALLAGLTGWSASRGNTRVNECRDLRLQLGGNEEGALDAWRSGSGRNWAAAGALPVPEIGNTAVKGILTWRYRQTGSN